MTLIDRIKELETLPDADIIKRTIKVEAAMRESLTKKRRRLLAVEGNIGTGKSTLAEFLGVRLGMTTYVEDVENDPYWRGTIEQFYKDRIKFGTSTQLALLHMRRAQLEEAYHLPGSAIVDRTYWADRFIFVPTLVEGGLPKNEVDLLEREYEKFAKEFPPIDLLILLTCSPEVSYERINQRGRAVEMATDLREGKLDKGHYLVKIGKRYDALADTIRETGVYTGPCIKVNYDTFHITEGRHMTALLEEMAQVLQI